MWSVQAMHKYMFRHLMISIAVTSHAICVWNVSEVQINIQIYAFNSDVNEKSAFNFLKIVSHLYHLVKQLQSLCWDDVNICNAFSIFFLSLLSLTFVILRYCNAVTSWNCYDSSYASMLIAMLMTMLMTIINRSPLDYKVVSRSTLFRISLCFSESYK